MRKGICSISKRTFSKFYSDHIFSIRILSFPIRSLVTFFSCFASVAEVFLIRLARASMSSMVGRRTPSCLRQVRSHSTRSCMSLSQSWCSSRQCWNQLSQYCMICNFFLVSSSLMQSKCSSMLSISRSTFFCRYSWRQRDCYNFNSISYTLGATYNLTNSSLRGPNASVSLRTVCCWQQVRTQRRQMLLRQVRQTCENSLKWRGHCRGLEALFYALAGVMRQVVERRCPCVVDFYGDLQLLRGSFHIIIISVDNSYDSNIHLPLDQPCFGKLAERVLNVSISLHSQSRR